MRITGHEYRRVVDDPRGENLSVFTFDGYYRWVPKTKEVGDIVRSIATCENLKSEFHYELFLSFVKKCANPYGPPVEELLKDHQAGGKSIKEVNDLIESRKAQLQLEFFNDSNGST